MGEVVSSALLVLDSWPVMEWLKDREPGASAFREILVEAVDRGITLVMCRINYGEVVYSLRKAPGLTNREEALKGFLAVPVRLYSVDDSLVDEAVDLKSQYAISYADAFAAALALRLKVPLVTGDREFRAVADGGDLKLLWVGK